MFKVIQLVRKMKLKKVKKFYFDKRKQLIADIQSKSDIDRLAILITKKDLRNNYPFKFSTMPKKRIYQYHESFGTTGRPSSSPLTKKDLFGYIEQILLSPVNFNDKDTVLIRYPYAISVPAHIFHRAAQNRNSTVIACSSRSFITPHKRVLELLKSLCVSVFCSLPAEAILLAECAKKLKYDLSKDFPCLRAICTAGEMLTPEMKKYIEKIWNVDVYNFYGSTEAGNIAYSCKYGNLHLADKYFQVNVIGHSTNFANQNTRLGNLIITTLCKQALPLLKYDTEDLASINYKHQCLCEIKSPVIDLKGRSFEYYLIHCCPIKTK